MSENVKENAPDAIEIPSSARKTAARRTLKLTIPTFESPSPESRQQTKSTDTNYKTGRLIILSSPQTAPCTTNLKNDENDVENNNIICGFDENSMAFDRNEGNIFVSKIKLKRMCK